MSIIALIKKSIVSNYNRLKMFIGCNKCKICGHLYIVNIDFTIADAYTERKLYNSRRLTVVLQMSLDEQLLNKKQFSELISYRAEKQIKQMYRDLMDHNVLFGKYKESRNWMVVTSKIKYLKSCSVYVNEDQKQVPLTV